MNNEKLEKDPSRLPEYITPEITLMTDSEVLKAFQMTATEISAAGCWWSASSWTRG
jgi:hypothetical protein